MPIRPDHPLNILFTELTGRHLTLVAGVDDTEMARYMASVLSSFTHVDNLYRIRDAKGKRLEEVAEMLAESNPLGDRGSFFREREVRRHIGDFTLFFAGIFPEYLGRLPRRGLRDGFIDYVQVGKQSYRVVAAFDQFEFARVAPLYRRLSERFELCVFSLNQIRAELEQNQRAWYRGVRQSLEL